MALNDTQEAINNAAANDLAKKMRLEGSLAIAMRKHFDNVNENFRNTYAKNGTIINADHHNPELKEILSNHYDKTSKEFSNNISSSIGVDATDHENIQNAIKENIKKNNKKQVANSMGVISDTTNQNINDSVAMAIAAAVTAGIIISKRDIADNSALTLAQKLDSRISSISVTETQKAAEGSKYVEYNTLLDNEADYPDADITIDASPDETKTWITILDSATRPAHAEADGQEVPANSAFTVWGENLNYPGDDSLGASIENIINCRCTMVFSI